MAKRHLPKLAKLTLSKRGPLFSTLCTAQCTRTSSLFSWLNTQTQTHTHIGTIMQYEIWINIVLWAVCISINFAYSTKRMNMSKCTHENMLHGNVQICSLLDLTRRTLWPGSISSQQLTFANWQDFVCSSQEIQQEERFVEIYL